MEKIVTKKFILRPVNKKDANDLAKHLNNWKVVKNLSSLPFPYELKHAQEYLKRITKEMSKEISENYVMAIEIDGEVVGAVGAHHIKHDHKAELGYWLAEEHWGKGIMTEVVKKFMQHAFIKFNLRRLCIKAYTRNKASSRVAEKVGMKLEGIEKKGALKDGKYIDCYVWAKVR